MLMTDFGTFLDASRSTLIPGTLPTLNLSIKTIFHQGSCIFFDIILVSNYHSYKEKTIKLLPYHSFYGSHIPTRKVEPFSGSVLQKNTKPPGSPFSCIPIKISNFIFLEVCNIPHLAFSFQNIN